MRALTLLALAAATLALAGCQADDSPLSVRLARGQASCLNQNPGEEAYCSRIAVISEWEFITPQEAESLPYPRR